MDRFKTILFYGLIVAGLILASMWFTRPGDPGDFVLPVTFTPISTATATPDPGTTATAEAERGCVPTAGTGANGYLPDIPFSVDIAPPGLKGERMVISGTLYANDCLTPLPGAMVEVWQTDADGNYDNTPPYSLRGKMRTDANGRYEFSTIKPGPYDLGQGQGPVHIHFQLSYRSEGSFATRLLFQDDPNLPSSMATSPMAIPLTKPEGPDGPVLHGTFDIIIPVLPPTPTPAPTATDERL
jgi:catechol 1,2-dioxygenase